MDYNLEHFYTGFWLMFSQRKRIILYYIEVNKLCSIYYVALSMKIANIK